MLAPFVTTLDPDPVRPRLVLEPSMNTLNLEGYKVQLLNYPALFTLYTICLKKRTGSS
jgi:hypothetical protein